MFSTDLYVWYIFYLDYHPLVNTENYTSKKFRMHSRFATTQTENFVATSFSLSLNKDRKDVNLYLKQLLIFKKPSPNDFIYIHSS